jgi:hypothetical protein
MSIIDTLLVQRRFRAKLGDRVYSDRLTYERDVRGLIDGAEPRRIKPGLDVCFDASGNGGYNIGARPGQSARMTWGQVWAPAPRRGHWWIRSDDGRTFDWSRSSCVEVNALGQPIKASA